MSFRYKSALLSLVSMAGVYAWYFLFLILHFRTGHPFNPITHLIGTIVLLVFFVHSAWLAVPLAAGLGLAVAGIGLNVQHDGGHSARSARRPRL